MRTLWCGAALLLAACGRDEPVLPGVPAQPLLQDQPTAPERVEAAEQAAAAPVEAPCALGPGMLVNARCLGGRTYADVRDVVAEQLGPLQQTRELSGDFGRELRFERGALRVVEDEIAMIRIELPEPLRRSEALAALGFHPYVGPYLTLHREYRLNHEEGFRRIRLMRVDRTSEMVSAVEAWYRVPGEGEPGR